MKMDRSRTAGDTDKPGEAGRPNHNPGAIPQIDTIRVLAMFGVFSHHLWNGVIVTPDGTLERVLDAIFDAGSDGVVFFNVISGFLLALPYLGPERRAFGSYGDFLSKRLLRIIPPYYVALLIFSLGNIVIFGAPFLAALKTLVLHLLFLNSFSYPMLMTNFSPFWYMGMLVQFYLLFPLLVRFLLSMGPARGALLTMGLCWGGWGLLALYLSANPESSLGMSGYMIRFNLPGRLPEFMIGMWLASTWNSPALSGRTGGFDRSLRFFLAGAVLYAVLGAPFVSRMGMPFLHIYHVAACLVFLMILFTWSPSAAMGRSTLMRKISESSYAVYIVHQPLFSYVGVLPGQTPETLGTFAFYLALLLPLAYLAALTVNGLGSLISGRVGR